MMAFSKFDQLYKVDKWEHRLRFFIDYLIFLAFQSLIFFTGELIMEDPDCDTSKGVCVRELMGFIDSSDT